MASLPQIPSFPDPPTAGSTSFGFDPRQLSGATRIGATWLYVPPINIHYAYTKFDRIMWTMRQQAPNRIKMGKGIMSFDIDIVFSGVYMINDKLAPIVAQIRRNPFITIYNETMRKIVYDEAYEIITTQGEVPVAITGYVINTETGLPDTIMLRLSCMVWNYRPMLNSLTYLKSVYNPKTNTENHTIPARDIEDSNLYSQYYRSALKSKIPHFMFMGELDQSQRNPNPLIGQSTTTQNDIIAREFPSRINKDLAIIRNGDIIKQVDQTAYVGIKPSFTIGYHLAQLEPTLDLSKGAYKSARSGKWIETESEKDNDIRTKLNNTDKTIPLSVLIAEHQSVLIDLPVRNNAYKYIKRITIPSTDTSMITGITIRHSIPLSILPIVSSPIPTAQYFGGAASDITLSFVTTDEEFVKKISSLDKWIEESARNMLRHSGSEYTYIENDIVNLNGTYLIETGDLDIQTVPGNPGTYIIQWMLHEQAEVFTALANLTAEIGDNKRKLIGSILASLANKNPQWSYQAAYNKKTKEINLRGSTDEFGNKVIYGSHASYIETMLIPTWIRIIRNAFVRWAKENGLGSGSSLIKDSIVATATLGTVTSFQNIKHDVQALVGSDDLDRLWEDHPEKDTALSFFKFIDKTAGLVLPIDSVLNLFNINATTSIDDELFNDRATAYQNIWNIMTGAGTGDNTALYKTLRGWLKDYNPNQSIIENVAQILSEADCRRFELLLRSPFLLDYEIRNLLGLNIDMTTSNPAFTFNDADTANIKASDQTIINTALSLVNSISALKTYPDLYLPFTYYVKDSNGNQVYKTSSSGNQQPLTIIFDEPSFYIKSQAGLSEHQQSKYIASNNNVTTIKQKHKRSSGGLNEVTQGYGSMLPSIERPDQMVGSNIFGLSPYVSKTDEVTNASNMTVPEYQNQIDFIQQKQSEALSEAQVGQTLNPLQYGSFKSVDDILINSNIAAAMGDMASQVSSKQISETQYEHRSFKAFLRDYNPDIASTMAHITNDLKKDLITNPNYYSFNRFLPTFKLYFRQENSPQWFLFDNFYDYRAVEYIKYFKDKASPAAVMEISLNDYMYTLTDFRALSAKINYKASARNSTERVIDSTYNTPIMGLLVRPGTQVQLRAGYNADPDKLDVMFNGFITETSPGEKFIIRCQSYGAELFVDSGLGAFAGWICPPKQLITWMLWSPKVKHLGDTFQVPVLPTGAFDYLDIFTFDDNIYINDTMEPGRHRYLQVYNADNMSMWDVLQDIAAAHPGYICATIPWDYRETIFFGRPDHYYKYTQDLGVKAAYPKMTSEAQRLIDHLVNNPNIDLTPEEQTTLQDIENVKTDSGYELLNYFQWVPTQTIINEKIDKYVADIYGGPNSTLYAYLMEYCRWVELLSTLASDRAMGNIQYFIRSASSTATVPTADDISIFRNVQTNITNISSIVNTPALNNIQVNNGIQSTDLSKTNQFSAQQFMPPAGNSLPISNSVATSPPPISHFSNNLAKQLEAGVLPQAWAKLDNAQQSAYLSALIGKPIKLEFFLTNSHSSHIIEQFNNGVTHAPSPVSGQTPTILGIGLNTDKDFIVADPTQLNGVDALSAQRTIDLQKAQALMQNLNATKDQSLLRKTASAVLDVVEGKTNTTVNSYVGDAQAFYSLTGIQSPIAILAWGMISHSLNKINAMVGNVGNQNTEFQKFIDKLTNNFLKDTNNAIYSTNLTTHLVLRNFILTNLVNISDAFQSIVNGFGHSPITKRFRQYHIATSYENIVDNNIWVDYSNMWNAVKVKYQRHDIMNLYVPWVLQILGAFGGQHGNEFNIQAGQTLYDRITKEYTLTVENAKTLPQARNYATSILTEGIRNMYNGTLTLLGNPAIKPWDVIYLFDDYSKMYGPVMVKTVTHIMSAEEGFVTIIEPQAYVEPMSSDISSTAAFMNDIFDIGLALLVAFPGIGEAGIVGEATAQTNFFAGKGIADIFTKQFWKDATGSLTEQGQAGFDAIKTWLSNSKDKMLQGYAETYDASVNIAWQEQIRGWLEANVPGVTANNSTQAMSTFTDQVIASINSSRANIPTGIAGKIPPIQSISEANPTELKNAMTSILSTEGLQAPQEQAIKDFISTISLKPIMSRVTAYGGAIGTLFPQGLNIATLAKAMGITPLNFFKIMAVATPVAYYQMFAGMDDPNYGCPLRITPLSYQGEPYVVGLDGLTHQYGIWNYVGNSWRRFIGSWRTMEDWFGEISSTIDQVWKS